MLKNINKVICIGVILSSLSFVAQADVVDEVNKSFEVGEKASLRLSNVNGDIEIRAWDKNTVEVTATIKADNQEDRDRIKVLMKQSGNTIDVETKYEKTRNHSHSGEVSYQVNVPSSIKLSDIDSVNGAITIEKVLGGMNLEVVNGAVDATGVDGDAKISSVNGSLKIRYQDNATDVNHIRLETVNGSIKLYLPENIGADVDVETMHGSIKNDFGLAVDKSGFIGRELQGVIGNGQADINIETVNGSVKILRN